MLRHEMPQMRHKHATLKLIVEDTKTSYTKKYFFSEKNPEGKIEA